MARMSVEEVYRGEKYDVISAATADYLTNGRPAEYDERTWLDSFTARPKISRRKSWGCKRPATRLTADGNADRIRVCADFAGYLEKYVVCVVLQGGGRYGKTKTAGRWNDTPEKERTMGKQLFAEITKRQTQEV